MEPYFMRPFYEIHDDYYKNNKKNGWTGWREKQEAVDKNTSILERVFAYPYVPKKGNLLELGCGAGNITLWAAKKGYNVYGVDISPTAIEWAGENALECDMEADFRVGNVLDLKDYNDNFFDIVLDGHCFHCIIGEDRKAFLSSAFRVLKRGGFFHIITLCNDPGPVPDFDPQSRCRILGDIAFRYIGLADDILKEVIDSGFTIMDWELLHFDDLKAFQEALLVECVKK
jgi:SAM-dependent methyltransferase